MIRTILTYGIGDKLRLKNSKVEGVVVHTDYKRKETTKKDENNPDKFKIVVEETKQYALNVEGYGYPQWYKEELLEEIIDEITPEAEAKVDYVLTDVFLKAKKLDIVDLINEKYREAN